MERTWRAHSGGSLPAKLRRSESPVTTPTVTGCTSVVDSSGARRWAFIYHSRGKRREMGLGRTGLKEARETAEEVRRQIQTGHRPDRSSSKSSGDYESHPDV